MADRRDRRDFTREEVLALLSYDPESGVFRWKSRTSIRVTVGDPAGGASYGYCVITVFGRKYPAHHLAWLVMTGEWPPLDRDIDHINRVRSDNRWANLRLATRSENNVNSKVRADSFSGVTGVTPIKCTGRWDARINVDGRVILLGTYDEMDDAVRARQSAEAKFYPEFSPS